MSSVEIVGEFDDLSAGGGEELRDDAVRGDARLVDDTLMAEFELSSDVAQLVEVDFRGTIDDMEQLVELQQFGKLPCDRLGDDVQQRLR